MRSRCEQSIKFESPNFPPLATAVNFDIKVDWQLVRRSPSAVGSRELLVEEQVCRKVATLHLVPDANNAVLEATFNAPGLVEGVIVEGFGKGNLPGNSRLKELVPRSAEEGLLTFLVSQCHRGDVGDAYSTSGSHMGAIMCGDLTLPAAFVKASLVLARSRERGAVSEQMKASWRGEVSEEPLLQRHRSGQVMRFWGAKLKRSFEDEEEVRTVVREVVQSVLFSAARFNELVSADELLAARPNLKFARTRDGLNLLHAAVSNFEPLSFQFLLAQFSLDELRALAREPDVFGYTPVLLALSLREDEALRLLSPLTSEVRCEDLPTKLRAELSSLVLRGDTRSVELFVLAGFRRFEAMKDVEGRSLVHAVGSDHQACSLGHLGLVQLFVGCCRAGFEEVDDEGCRPGHTGGQPLPRHRRLDLCGRRCTSRQQPVPQEKAKQPSSPLSSETPDELLTVQPQQSPAEHSRELSDSRSL